MMRSLYAGVAGLKTHQTKMDVIGNNIANVNTTAYKAQTITFNEMLYQTTRQASGANAATGVGGINASQIGLGVKTGAINTNITSQGAMQTTNLPFDLTITGESFFVVNNGSENYFTRAGSFYIDGAGNLAMTSTGYNVMGWAPDADGNIMPVQVTPLNLMNSKNMTFDAEATTKATVSGIVDKFSTDINSTSGKIMNLQFFNDGGFKNTAKLSVHAIDGDAGKYYVQLDDILDANGASLGITGVGFGSSKLEVDCSNAYSPRSATTTITPGVAPAPDEITVEDNDSGETYTVEIGKDVTSLTTGDKDALKAIYGDGIDVENIKSFNIDVNGTLTVTKKDVSNAAELIYDAGKGTFMSVDGSTEGLMNMTFDSTWPGFATIELDFSSSQSTNNNKSSTIGAEAGNAGFGTGRKKGDMSEIIVQKDGLIIANYDNGQRRVLGQIAVATFANPSGLEKRGDNLYSASMNSGEFDGIGDDITNSGYMTSGVLEMSNVDLSSEFTEMITTQRGFQANSRIITVSDTLLEELTNLKR